MRFDLLPDGEGAQQRGPALAGDGKRYGGGRAVGFLDRGIVYLVWFVVLGCIACLGVLRPGIYG